MSYFEFVDPVSANINVIQQRMNTNMKLKIKMERNRKKQQQKRKAIIKNKIQRTHKEKLPWDEAVLRELNVPLDDINKDIDYLFGDYGGNATNPDAREESSFGIANFNIFAAPGT